MTEEIHIKAARRDGWSLIDLLTFIAAAAVVAPIAKAISGSFEGGWRKVVYVAMMLVVYPLVGFLFLLLRERIIGFFSRNRRMSGAPKDQRGMEDSQPKPDGDGKPAP